MVEALVEYEYIAEQDDELTLKPGDIITNIIQDSGGWWTGTINGKTGVFPDNFVKVITKNVDAIGKRAKSEQTTKGSSNVHKLAENLKKSLDQAPAPGAAKRPGNTARRKLRAKVSFSYAPQNEDELELKVGEVVEIEKQEEDGWWEGTVHGKKGVFPSNFVDLVDDDAATAESTETQEEEFKEIKGKKPKGFGFGNIFAQGAGGAEMLQKVKKSKSQEDSIKSAAPKINDRKSASVKEPPREPPVLPSREPKSVSKQPPAPPPKVRAQAPDATTHDEPKVEKAKVLFPYKAENEDELNLDEGQIIVILDKEEVQRNISPRDQDKTTELEDSGWWKGELHGKMGVFPDNFVELIPEEKPKRPAPPMPTPTKTKSKSPPPQDKEPPRHELKEIPAVSSKVEAPAKKPGPPLLTKKPTTTTKSADPKLIAQTDDHKVQEQKTETSDPNPPLVHLNKSRPKAPNKRPPNKSANSMEKSQWEADPPLPGRPVNVHRPAPEPPLVSNASLKVNKISSHKESSPEPETHNGPLPVPERPPAQVKTDSPRHAKLEKQEPVSVMAAGASSAEVAELRHELETLRAEMVPRKQHEQLHKQVDKLQAAFDEMKRTYDKKLYDLSCELDEEKKLRQNAVVDMERVKKLLAPK